MILKGNIDLEPAQHAYLQHAPQRSMRDVLDEQRQALDAGDIQRARDLSAELITIIGQKRSIPCT